MDERFSRVQRRALGGLRAFGGDAVDVAVGLVELGHDAVVIDRIGVARQDGEDLGQAGLLAVQFVDQAVGDGLLADEVRGILLDGLHAADAHNGGGEQQQNDQSEAARRAPGRCSVA